MKKIRDLQDKIDDIEKGQSGSDQFIDNFIMYKNIDKLIREVVVALIEMIYIYENNKIKIVFKYQNPFKEAMEYIGNNKTLPKEEQAKALLGALLGA